MGSLSERRCAEILRVLKQQNAVMERDRNTMVRRAAGGRSQIRNLILQNDVRHMADLEMFLGALVLWNSVVGDWTLFVICDYRRRFASVIISIFGYNRPFDKPYYLKGDIMKDVRLCYYQFTLWI